MAKDSESEKVEVVVPELDSSDLAPIKHPKITKRGRKAIELDRDQIKQVEIMGGLGMKMADISLVLGFSEKTLYNLCERDDRILRAMKSGKAKAVSAVSQTAYQMAKSGKHLAMTIFWLKCQQRWREVHPEDTKQMHEVTFRTKIGDKGQIISEQIEDTKDGRDDF